MYMSYCKGCVALELEKTDAWGKSAKALEAPLAKALPLTKALEILRPPPKALWAVTEQESFVDIRVLGTRESRIARRAPPRRRPLAHCSPPPPALVLSALLCVHADLHQEKVSGP
ncbi:hypothetical protein C8R45DRAFT_945501 [Mycena sanguinolenta]|nr:hypothetical protein C8R45DRAFT_945501 [Mycena sanguinolenta]